LISFDCRAHGRTRPVGPPEKISLAAFADDLLALMDHLRIDKAVVGGISMGAAVALNFALRYPQRLLGLVLHRPAWLDGPRRDNISVFTAIASLLRGHGAEKGMALFKQSEIYRRALAESPGTAESLASQFLHPRAQETVVRLEKIPLDSPGSDRRQWRAIDAPTLVLANDHDAIHPLAYGVTLAREIPGAQFKELTAKSISVDLHREETQRFLEDFLFCYF
jgi:pimeloyl-ACP methyl ester carboxylesterase